MGRFMLVFLLLKPVGLGDSQTPTFWLLLNSTVGVLESRIGGSTLFDPAGILGWPGTYGSVLSLLVCQP